MKINRFLATTVTNTLLLLLLGVSLYIIEGGREKIRALESEFVVSVYLSDTTSTQTKDNMESLLKNHPSVVATSYISPEMAFEEFSEQVDVKLDKLFESSPLPGSFRINLSPKSVVEDFEKEVAQIAGVEEVNYPHQLREEVREGVRLLSYYVLGFAFVLALVLLVIYHNTIRMDVAASSDRIARAVAGRIPLKDIRRPFRRRAYVQGVMAALVAAIILVLMVEVVTLPIDKLSVDRMSLGVIISCMILTGMILSLLFTLRAVERILKKVRPRKTRN